jgi:hypothetical protein
MSRANKTVVEHPSSRRNARNTAAVFLLLREQHAKASDLMWIGMLSQFASHEIETLRGFDYLSPRDERCIKQLRREDR